MGNFQQCGVYGKAGDGLRYYNPARDSRDAIFDHYTGVGEVLAVHDLDQVFGLLHHQIRVKRGSLFSLDDAKNNDLIFVGSPSENLTLLEIPGAQEFVFQRVPVRAAHGRFVHRECAPAAGRAESIFGDAIEAAARRRLRRDRVDARIESIALGDDPGGHHDIWNAGRGGVRLPPERSGGPIAAPLAGVHRRAEAFRGGAAREGRARRAGEHGIGRAARKNAVERCSAIGPALQHTSLRNFFRMQRLVRSTQLAIT